MPQGDATLEGAEFTVKYYDGYYTKDNLPEKATRTWEIQTKKREIAGKTYYIPTTTRIQNTNQTIDQKVSLLLDHFENNTKVETTKKSQLNDGLLSIYLSSRILDNSENISPTLYSRLEKSFLSLPDVSSVHIYINNELIQEDQNVSTSIDNIVQI